jgi:peptidoglycan/LPS O-acetylase OafA/YrhL
VDGLRALAVVPVILFHAGASAFGGGYVGVDVFFVISGYLITSIIASDCEAGTFSIAGFYERRARRILPALFVVMLVCVPLAWYWMVPEELENFAQSLAAVAVFGSNVLFWITSGYFDSVAEEKPLLHTWSLGVEEQYYVVFPLFLALLWRRGRPAALWATLAVAAASFALSEWGWRTQQAVAHFFLTPARVWELLLGSVLALVSFRTPLDRRVSGPIADLAAAAGLLLVTWAVFTFDRSTPSPSAYTLAPTVGTALILAFARPSGPVARLLSLKWIVGIGLISYSAYLWHQPLFAYARLASAYHPSPWVFGALTALTFVLAYLTWRYVETPLRRRDRFTRRQIFAGSVAGSVFFVALGLTGHVNEGFAGAAPDPGFTGGTESPNIVDAAGRPCRDRQPEDVCRFPGLPGRQSVIVVGDSHASVLSAALREPVRQAGFGFVDLTLHGCYYAPGLHGLDNGRLTTCTADYQARRHAWLMSQPVAIVVVHGRLPLYLTPENFDNQEGGIEKRPPYLLSAYPPRESEPERLRMIADSIRSSVRDLMARGHTVVLVYPVPETGWHPRRRATSLAGGQLTAGEIVKKSSVSYRVTRERMQASYDILDTVPGPAQPIRVYPEELFCNQREPGRCDTIADNQYLYFDFNHLSEIGAARLAEKVVAAMPRPPA